METQIKNYRSREVAKLTGATLRMLQFWDERGIITARLDGHRRLYSESQVGEIRKLIKARRAGVSLQQFRKLSAAKWEHVRCIKRPTIIGDVLFVPKAS